MIITKTTSLSPADIGINPLRRTSLDLLFHLIETHELGHAGDHGADHWLRVLLNGQEIAASSADRGEINLKVVELFALLHDSRRENEGEDPQHGPRAALYARSLRGTWFDLSDREMELLEEACRLHSDGHTEGDPTVRACWDADRLDLWRVGIEPMPERLCTDHGRMFDTIAGAQNRYAKSMRDLARGARPWEILHPRFASEELAPQEAEEFRSWAFS